MGGFFMPSERRVRSCKTRIEYGRGKIRGRRIGWLREARAEPVADVGSPNFVRTRNGREVRGENRGGLACRWDAESIVFQNGAKECQ